MNYILKNLKLKYLVFTVFMVLGIVYTQNYKNITPSDKNTTAANAPFSFKEIEQIPYFELQQPQFLSASDGVPLAYYSFVDKNCSSIVLLYPGAGLYGNKTYQWVAKTLQEKYQIGCYIFDIRGHGNSFGPRGDASSQQQVWNDVAAAVQFVKRQYPFSKIYLMGHSSGAGLIINYVAHSVHPLEDGYIFVTPYLGPKSNAIYESSDTKVSFIKSVRTWLYIVCAFLPQSFLNHCKAVWFNYPDAILRRDPLIVSSYTYAMSMATTPYEIDQLLTKIKKPVAIFIGNQDEQFIPQNVLGYSKLISASIITELIPDLGHLSILLKVPELTAQVLNNKEFDYEKIHC
jgi:acylglycerol lipase